MEYTTRGTCSSLIKFDVDGDKVKDVQFVMGCHGNTQGVAKLVEGMDIHEVIKRLKGIDCNGRGTSMSGPACTGIRTVFRTAEIN